MPRYPPSRLVRQSDVRVIGDRFNWRRADERFTCGFGQGDFHLYRQGIVVRRQGGAALIRSSRDFAPVLATEGQSFASLRQPVLAFGHVPIDSWVGAFDSVEREPVEYNDMTANAKRIEQEIRELPLEDMLVLHDQLVTSIHEKEETQKLDPAFREEIQRRVKEIDSGKVEGVDALQALKEM